MNDERERKKTAGRGRDPSASGASDRASTDELRETEADDAMERLLSELPSVDLPPFYRTRLLARIREASRRAPRGERLRAPQIAWGVAAVCIIALVVIALRTPRVGRAPIRQQGVEMVDAASTSIDPVMPADNSVVGAGDVEIVASIYPPIEGGIVRLYVDETDVTGLADVGEDYVMYSPHERFEEGEHIVTIEIHDGSGRKLKDVSWLFYTLNGRRHDAAERI